MSQISVIVPVYKVEPYLQHCIDSILAQTFADFELILVDDGSPDGCGKICERYATQDSRVMVIHQKNGGLSAARNSGIDWAFACSNSEWISFIDSDDWVHPQYLESLYRAATENAANISVCGFAETNGENPQVDTTALHAVVWRTEDFFVEKNVNAVIACGKLYQKTDFEEIRYPIGKINEDEFTTYKILFRYEQIPVVEQPLYAYYQNPQSIMLSEWTPRFLVASYALEERILFFEKHHWEKLQMYGINSLLGNMEHHILYLRLYGEKYKKEYRKYLKRFRRNLWKYRKKLSPQKRKHYYMVLHPYCYAFCQYTHNNGILFSLKKVFGFLQRR